MSIQPRTGHDIPEATSTLAKKILPEGNMYMRVRDELGEIFTDEQFATLFAVRGQPALAPGRLALITLFQFAEGLSDRQAAEAVRFRIDWKYCHSSGYTVPHVVTQSRPPIVTQSVPPVVTQSVPLVFTPSTPLGCLSLWLHSGTLPAHRKRGRTREEKMETHHHGYPNFVRPCAC